MEHFEVSKSPPVLGMLPIYFGFHFSLDPNAHILLPNISRTGAIIVPNVCMSNKSMCNRHMCCVITQGVFEMHMKRITSASSV